MWRCPDRPGSGPTPGDRGGHVMTRSLTLRALALVVLTAVSAGVAEAQTPKKGGVLRIGNLGEPPSLDPHWGTQTITEVLANHIFEGLYALDEGYQPIPMLAE